jgi:O-antigen/teichoic acid export membrane protein
MGLFLGFFTWLTQIFIKISDSYALTVSVELLKIGHKIISLALLLFFIYQLPFNLEKYFYFNYIALISFLLIITSLFIKKNIFVSGLFKIQNLQFKTIAKEFTEYCHPLVVYSVVGIISGIFDLWLLQTIAGSEQTGFYGLAYNLAAMCFLFTSAMTPIIMREFSKSYEQKDLEQIKRLFYRYIPMLYSIATYFGVFVSMQSENVLAIFTDEKFKDAYSVLLIMAFYPIHQTYGQLSGSVFYATGQTKLMRNIILFTMPLGMAISFFLIYIFDLGAIGLAYKMLIGQIIGVNIQLYFNAKFLGMNIRYFLWHQVYSLLFFTLLAFIACNIVTIPNHLLNFLLSGFIYTIFVIISAYILPHVFATTREEIKIIFQKVVNVAKR